MDALNEVLWPQPLAELLGAAYESYRQSHPWLPDDALAPKSVVRTMWEQAMSFTDLISRYKLARSKGWSCATSDAYRTLRQTVPDAHRDPELEDLVDWLGETIHEPTRRCWMSGRRSPTRTARSTPSTGTPSAPLRPLTANDRAFRAMIRRAMWRPSSSLPQYAQRPVCRGARLRRLTEPPSSVVMDTAAWDAATGDLRAEHDEEVIAGRGRPRTGIPLDPGRTPTAGAGGRSGGPSPTRPVTATGSLRLTSTWTRVTPWASSSLDHCPAPPLREPGQPPLRLTGLRCRRVLFRRISGFSSSRLCRRTLGPAIRAGLFVDPSSHLPIPNRDRLSGVRAARHAGEGGVVLQWHCSIKDDFWSVLTSFVMFAGC